MLRRRLLLPALVGLLTLASLTLAGCGEKGPTGPGGPNQPQACAGAPASEVTTVAVEDESITVEGSVTSPCPSKVQIFALDPSATEGDLAGSTSVANVTPSANGTFSVSFDRFDGDVDRVYSEFVAVGVTGGASEVIGQSHYADDFQIEATNSAPRFEATTQKGLAVSMTSDAEMVGVDHAAVSVGVNYMLRAGAGEPGTTIEFESHGKTYHFDKKYVQWLDHTIKPLSDDDVLVYLVLVLVYDDEPNSSFPLLVHPGAPTGPPPSFMTYAFDTETPDGIAAYTALMEFISERYTRDDQQFGRAMDYIVGNEIDSAGVWQQMGEKTLPQFIDAYTPALRIAWQAARQQHADARVYTSLDHFWNSTANPADPLRFYKGKDVIDTLAAKVKAGGDFPWNLAYHPYPADMMNPDTWNDPVTDDPGSPKITFKNIAQLPQYLAQPELTFEGVQRHIILSEQGCQSPSNSVVDQERQAACFAYSYYKIRAAGGIDAYLWDPQVDNRDALGLQIGLWTWDDKRLDFPASPGEKKQIYNLFRDIDTDDSLALTEFAKPVIGITDWNEVIPNFDASMIDRRTVATQVGARTGAVLGGSQTVSDFESGVDGWRTADHTNRVEAITTDAGSGDGALSVHFDDAEIVFSNGTNSKVWRGADVPFASPIDASAKPHLSAQIRLPHGIAESFEPGNRFSAQIRAYGADGTVAYGIGSLDPTSGWNRVTVDLSGWDGRDAIERIKVWVKGSSGENWLGTAEIDDVTLSTNATGGVPNLEFTAKAGDREGVGSGVTIAVTNNDATSLPADLEVVACHGVDLVDDTLATAGLAGGGASRVVTSTFAAYDPTDPEYPTLCVSVAGRTFEIVVSVPPPPPTLLFDFEDGVQGWTAGENVSSIGAVGWFPNGPQKPHGGESALEAVLADGDASATKTVRVRPEVPLPLGGATELYAWVDAYGGVAGATGYEATMTVHSGDESISVVNDEFVPDSWNKLTIDLSGWPFRDAVTGIDISYRALGTSFDWVGGPRMQVDDIGVEGSFDDDAAWRAAWGASIGGHFSGDSREDATYRQAMQVSASGSDVRIRFTNPSAETLTFEAATVGLRNGTGAGTVGTPKSLTLEGSAAIIVPAGASVYSDPVHLAVAAGQELLVSTYAEDALPLLTHDFALKTQFASSVGSGDRTGDTAGDAFATTGTSIAWIDAIDVFTSDVAGAVVVLGDSITDGAGSDLDADNRWPNRLSERLLALGENDGNRRAVVNAGIGGNTLSAVGNAQVGENGLLRLERDVLSQTGVTDVIVLAGTNDLYVGSSSEQVIYALTKVAQRAHREDLRVIVSTLIPRGNGTGWTAALEQERLEVNAWIRTQGVFDAVIDLEAATRDPSQPDVILAAYDADGTHPNSAGYQAMADAVDLAVFSKPRITPNASLEVISDLEADATGWQAGIGVAGVERVTGFANGPGIPLEGRGALNAALASASAGVPKTVVYAPANALDLTGSREIYAWVDAYGGLPDALGYVVDITVRSGNESITGTNSSFSTDRWNRVAVDVDDWVHLDAVTSVEITYRVEGSTTTWTGAQMQVDELGALRTVAPPMQGVVLEDFEDGVSGWQAGSGVLGVSTVGWFPNGPHLPHGGAAALQAVMAEGDVSVPKTVSVALTEPMDLSDATDVGVWFDGYGGVPDATGYAVDITIWSGADSITGTLEGYQSDQWSRVSVEIAGWVGRSSVDRIDVTYRVLGSTFAWVGQPLFQIDDLYYRH